MFEDGSLDRDSLRKLLDWHVAEGTDAICIVGTTGESATVSPEEHCELIKLTVDHVAGRVPVIAGTGGNSTAEAIALTRHAREVGADASLQVVPYYNRPSQEGMYRHFKAIAESTDLPVYLYNVPGRTVADMSNDTVVRLAAIDNIVGIKDATGNLARCIELLREIDRSFAGKGRSFGVYSGDDASALALMLCGGAGNISVTANVAPRAMAEMCKAALSGQTARAIEINNSVLDLHSKLFVEPNPVPVKWALAEMGKMPAGVRMPLAPLAAQYHDTVRAALRASGVL
jgi:4-hydroxy-tetrahydrodipicolinate synthase